MVCHVIIFFIGQLLHTPGHFYAHSSALYSVEMSHSALVDIISSYSDFRRGVFNPFYLKITPFCIHVPTMPLWSTLNYCVSVCRWVDFLYLPCIAELPDVFMI
jgi:hypothetical protein